MKALKFMVMSSSYRGNHKKIAPGLPCKHDDSEPEHSEG